MSYELQFSGEIFSRITRNRIRSLRLCPGQSVGEGGEFVVDFIEVLDGTTIQHEQQFDPESMEETPSATQPVIVSPTLLSQLTVPWLQVRQPVRIKLVTPVALLANGTASSPAAPANMPLDMTVVLNVGVDVPGITQGGSTQIRMIYSFAYVHPGLAGGFMSAAQREQLQSELAQRFNIAPVELDLRVLGDASEGLGQAGQDFRVRAAGLATNGDRTVVALRLETNIHNSPVLLDRSFFEQGPQDLLQGSDWAMLIDADVVVDGMRRRVSEALSDRPKVKLVGGPNVTWQPNRPGLDVYVRIKALNACPAMVEDADIDARVQLRCALSCPPQQPDRLVTRFEMDTSPVITGQAINCIVTNGLFWPFVGPLLLKSADAPFEAALPSYLAGCWIPPLLRMAALFTAFQAYSPPIPEELGNNCQKIDDDTVQCEDTVDLLMPLNSSQLTRLTLRQVLGRPAGLVLRGTIGNLRDVPAIGPVTVESSPMEWFYAGGCRQGGFFLTPQAEITVSGVGEDLLCSVTRLSEDPQNAYEIDIDGDMVKVRVRNPNALPSYGCTVHVVTLNGVRTLTYPKPQPITDERQAEMGKLVQSFNKMCQQRRDALIERQVVNWGRDDPVDQLKALQVWELAVVRMQDAQDLRIVQVDGRSLVEARASQAGSISMALIFPKGQAPAALSLERRMADREKPANVVVRQQEYVEQYRFNVIGTVRSMAIDLAAAIPTLTIIEDRQKATWNISEHSDPALVRIEPLPAGEAARERLDADQSAERTRRALARQGWRVITGASVPHVAGARSTIIAQRGEETAVFDVSMPAEPRLLQIYHQPPWFLTMTSVGRFIARYVPHDCQRGTVELYVAKRRPTDASTAAAMLSLPEKQRSLVKTVLKRQEIKQ